MPEPKVVIVHLGRAGGMGVWRRVEGLTRIFEAAGASVEEVLLRVDHRLRLRDLARPGLADLSRGRCVPESASWSHRSLAQALHRIDPAVVVCCTARAFHPSIMEPGRTVVLDLVDRLSISYRDRSGVPGIGPKRILFRALSFPHARFESHATSLGVVGIAAGRADAEALGVEWVPNTLEVPTDPPPESADAPHDLLFFGSLGYPPNVEAVHRLARVWPDLQRARPGTTLLVAGASPTQAVVDLATRCGWTLVPDFADLASLVAEVRMGVVPLEHASGIQMKVLELAAFGRAQVISPAAAAGLDPAFPVAIAASDVELVAEIVRLLGDSAARRAAGDAARRHVAAEYGVARWVPWARGVLSDPRD